MSDVRVVSAATPSEGPSEGGTVVTIAGEGLELPILTDHGVHVDVAPTVAALRLGGHFTPVVGNELTTPVGHFNLFPVPADAPPPEAEVHDWEEVRRGISGLPGVVGIVLNHPRDLHAGFRPFGSEEAPALPAAGETGSGNGRWTLPANAMEILNSGSQPREPRASRVVSHPKESISTGPAAVARSRWHRSPVSSPSCIPTPTSS